jgi:hypothetical protein
VFGDDNVSLVVDATDGGYILVSFASPPEEEWAPSEFAKEPGQVCSTGNVATINSLTSDGDERVLLSCVLLNSPLTEREVERRANQGAHVVRFVFEASGPIVVLSNELEEQGLIAEDLKTSIQLECCVFMVLEPDKLYPTDPVEQHHLRMWPADSTPRAAPWWIE